MSKTDVIISGLRGPCSDCEGNEHDTCIRCQLEFDAADEIERLIKEIEDLKQSLAVDQEPFALELAEQRQENAKLREERDEIISMRDAAEAHVIRLRAENAKLRERVEELESFIDSSEDVLTRKEGGDDER